MKRSVRRALAIGLGLVMGWCAAGFLPGSTSVSSPTLAQEQAAGDGHDHASSAANTPSTAPVAAAAPGADGDKAGAMSPGSPAPDAGEAKAAATQPAAGHDAGHGEPGQAGTRAEAGHAKSPSQLAAESLRPGASDMGWYGKVVLAIIGLFVLALVVGSLAVKFRSTPPADPPGAGHGG